MFNKHAFGLSVASTMGVLYIVCAVFVWAAPAFTLQLLGWVTHIVNVEKFAGDVVLTFQGLVFGLLQILVSGYISGWIFAWFYNRFAR